MKETIINILFSIGFLCIIGYVLKLYEKANKDMTTNAISLSNNNPKMFYIITPILFWVASHAFLFKNANGPLMLHIKILFDNLNIPNLFKLVVPFTSLVMIVLGNLFSTYAGGALGSEAVIVNIAVILLLYGISLLSKIGIENIEGLLYIGYTFGFTYAFKSPMASLVLGIEKSLSHPASIITNIIYSCIGITIGSLFLDKEKIFPNVAPVEFTSDISTTFHYGLFSIISGILTCFLFNFMFKTYSITKNIHTNNRLLFNIIPIMAGLCVALIINKTDYVSVGQGKQGVDDMLSGKYVYTVENTISHIVNIFLTFISGSSGGLIIPSIAIGSYFGFLYNKITSLPLLPTIIIGMTTVFSAFFGYPLASACIIMNILNQKVDSLPLLIICAYISYFVCKYMNKLLAYIINIK
jgi:H+/Cl- antiporter ClcA